MPFPQRLDANYRLQRHVYDFTRRYYLLGRDQMLERLLPPRGGTVLEIGCGTARNLVCAAERYPDADFFGVDLSQMMLDVASRSLERAGLRGRVAVARGDATNFDPHATFGRRTFDCVFFSYSLSMIPDWRSALSHGASLLSQGGSLHVVDFGRLEGLPPAFAHTLRWWLGRYHVTPRESLERELSRLGRERRMVLEFGQPFRTYASLALLAPTAV
jgi:S-adenosylmethionine-diacylgycerolhomoserine-N-methlytransferase